MESRGADIGTTFNFLHSFICRNGRLFQGELQCPAVKVRVDGLAAIPVKYAGCGDAYYLGGVIAFKTGCFGNEWHVYIPKYGCIVSANGCRMEDKYSAEIRNIYSKYKEE